MFSNKRRAKKKKETEYFFSLSSLNHYLKKKKNALSLFFRFVFLLLFRDALHSAAAASGLQQRQCLPQQAELYGILAGGQGRGSGCFSQGKKRREEAKKRGAIDRIFMLALSFFLLFLSLSVFAFARLSTRSPCSCIARHAHEQERKNKKQIHEQQQQEEDASNSNLDVFASSPISLSRTQPPNSFFPQKNNRKRATPGHPGAWLGRSPPWRPTSSCTVATRSGSPRSTPGGPGRAWPSRARRWSRRTPRGGR